jgi:hypothetical protein
MIDMAYVCREPGTRAHGITPTTASPPALAPSRCVVLKASLLPGGATTIPKVLANQNLLKQSHLPTSTLTTEGRKCSPRPEACPCAWDTNVVICHRREDIACIMSSLLDAACIPGHLALHISLVALVTSWSVDHTVPETLSRPQLAPNASMLRLRLISDPQAKSYIVLGNEPLNPPCLSPVERQSGTHI